MELLIFAAVVCLLVSCSLLSGTILVIHRYEVPDNSRTVLATAFFFSAAVWIVWLVVHFLMPNLTGSYPVLAPFSLAYALIFMQLISLYSMEVIRPNQATKPSSLVMFFLPGVVAIGMLLYCAGNFHVMDYIYDFGRFTGCLDVWVRLLMLVMVMVYSVSTAFVPSNRFRSSASKKWVRRWYILQTILSAFFALAFLSREDIYDILLMIFMVVFCCVLAYDELELRIAVSEPPKHASRKQALAYKEQMAKADKSSVPVKESVTPEVRNAQLWERIEALMNQEVWRSPDLDINSFSLMALSNRTYVSQCISPRYPGGFKELINRYRVEWVKAQIDAGSDEAWNDLFFNAGYRSRSTAWRNFTVYVGVSPQDYTRKTPAK